MENRIPIDELFHDKLSQGREQMNLGAWANMERMLDGKNPYLTDEDKKKRGLIPFFFVFLLGAGLAGATYFYYNSSQPNAANAISQSATTPATLSNHLSSNEQGNLTDVNQSSNTGSANVASSVNPSSNMASAEADNKTKESAPSLSKSQPLTAHTTNQTPNTSDINSTPTSNHNSIHHLRVRDHNQHDNQLATNTQTKESVVNHTKQVDKAEPKLASALPARLKKKGLDLNDAKDPKDQIMAADVQGDNHTEKIVENIPVVSINQKAVRQRDGNIKGVVNDTLGTSIYEKVTERPSSERVTASLDPMMTNPRYKVLSAEEEQNARKQSSYEETQPPVASAPISTPSEASVKTSEISIASAQKAKQVKHTGYFEDLRKFFSDTYNKVYNFMVYAPKPNVYTGMNAGFNASFSNSIGGFHGGFTMLTPLSDYFSILTELKFFDRINGGYTVNDISYGISNQTVDNSSIVHQSIYSYTKDSSVKTYNIKNFYSLELPLMIQLNSRSFAFYGGVNLAYSFKLKTTDKVRMYHQDYHDTLESTLPYSYPVDKGSQLQRDDFASRFGVGYTVGASYNFSPQLYIDLRLAQNVWDNMKSNTARDISNGFFKVPSIQFSLGYRFRKFTPDN